MWGGRDTELINWDLAVWEEAGSSAPSGSLGEADPGTVECAFIPISSRNE